MTWRVLLLRPRVDPGGASEHISSLCRGLGSAGIDVFLGTAGGASQQALLDAGAMVRETRLWPSSPTNLIIAVAQLTRFVRGMGISIIHSHHRFSTLVGRLVARLTGVPLVVTVHEYRFSHRWLGRAFSGDVTIVPSAALARHLCSHYRFDPDAVAIIPNGIPLDARSMATEARESAQQTTDGAPAVGYLGRLSAEKGVRYFIESVPLVAAQCPSARHMVFGEGPEEFELRDRARALGLSDPMLAFRGWCDAQRAMDELDVLVIPSLEEGFGHVALEAMRASLPIVASSVGGLPEIIVDRESGLLVPPRDPAAIASAVCTLLKDAEMRLRFGRRGREILEERFSVEAMVRSTIQVYETVLGHALAL